MQKKLCTICGKLKSAEEFYNKNLRQLKSRCKKCLVPIMCARQKMAYRKMRLEAMTHYCGGSPKCGCCGEWRTEFLTIDHTNGGGKKHRKQLGSNNGPTLYRWLKKNGYPSGFRVLCMNCNLSYGIHGYCPHQREATESTDHVAASHDPSFSPACP